MIKCFSCSRHSAVKGSLQHGLASFPIGWLTKESLHFDQQKLMQTTSAGSSKITQTIWSIVMHEGIVQVHFYFKKEGLLQRKRSLHDGWKQSPWGTAYVSITIIHIAQQKVWGMIQGWGVEFREWEWADSCNLEILGHQSDPPSSAPPNLDKLAHSSVVAARTETTFNFSLAPLP